MFKLSLFVGIIAAVTSAHAAHASCVSAAVAQIEINSKAPSAGIGIQAGSLEVFSGGFFEVFTAGQFWLQGCDGFTNGGGIPSGPFLKAYQAEGDSGGILGFPIANLRETVSNDGH